MLFLNIVTALFLMLTLRCHSFKNILVIFNIPCNSIADLASKAIPSVLKSEICCSPLSNIIFYYYCVCKTKFCHYSSFLVLM